MKKIIAMVLSGATLLTGTIAMASAANIMQRNAYVTGYLPNGVFCDGRVAHNSSGKTFVVETGADAVVDLLTVKFEGGSYRNQNNDVVDAAAGSLKSQKSARSVSKNEGSAVYEVVTAYGSHSVTDDGATWQRASNYS